MAAQRFARSAAAKTTAFHPESGGELSERGKEQQKEIKEALLAQQKEDEDRLIKIKQDRAAAEYAKLKKKALVEVGRMGKVQTADLAKALSKLDTSLGANGQVIAAINRAFNKAEGAPVPEATALLSSIRTHMSVLVSTVGGKTERMEIVINELEGYLSERDERLETTAAGLPKILQTLYDTDVLDEDVIMAWWGDVTGQTDALEAAVEPAAAYAQKVEKDLETANKNVKDAEARLEQCKKDAKLASKEVDNARTGGNPTSEEQLREKEARRMDKVCQSALANAKPKCVACQKIAGELFNELPKAQEAAKAAELAAKANKRITELCKPLIDWLAEDDDDSSDSDSD